MTHDPEELRTRIARFLAEERFEEVRAILPAYAHAVVASCNSKGDAAKYAEARDFLKEALHATQARRAHMAATLSSVRVENAYHDRAERSSWTITG
jgi:hypothetical protein